MERSRKWANGSNIQYHHTIRLQPLYACLITWSDHVSGPTVCRKPSSCPEHDCLNGRCFCQISYPAALPDPASEGSLCTATLANQSVVILSNAPVVWGRAELSLHLSGTRGQGWGPTMAQGGGCVPVSDPEAAVVSSAGGARCRSVADAATFSDYSSLWCGPGAADDAVSLGFGRIVALYHRSSTLYHNH